MYLKPLYIIILVFLLEGCGNNKLSYIENDNYSKNYQYYLHDIKLKSRTYEIKSIFDDKKSYITTKQIINHMKKKYINKYNIYIVILCPQNSSTKHNVKIFFNYIEDFYNFLITEKNFSNQIYTLGVPAPDLDKYKAIIYFVN